MAVFFVVLLHTVNNLLYTYSDCVTKTTFPQLKQLLRLSLGFLTNLSRQTVFVPEKYNVETSKASVCQTALLARLPYSYLFMKYDVFRQNADFFSRIGV